MVLILGIELQSIGDKSSDLAWVEAGARPEVICFKMP